MDNLTLNSKHDLDQMLEKKEDGKDTSVSIYKLTLLKKPNQGTNPSKIQANLNDLAVLKEVFSKIKKIIPILDLSYEGIRYYSK